MCQVAETMLTRACHATQGEGNMTGISCRKAPAQEGEGNHCGTILCVAHFPSRTQSGDGGKERHGRNLAASAATGSTAFVYMFVKPLADGGVKYGLPRKDYYAMAWEDCPGWPAKIFWRQERNRGS